MIFKRILLFFLLGLHFILGILREKIVLVLDSFFEVSIIKNENFILRPLLVFFQQKIPVFLANFGILFSAPFFLLLTLLCLSIYFHWKGSFFFKVFVVIILFYFFTAIVLIFTFTAHPPLVRLWHDFTDIYFSPLLLIFLFFIFKIGKTKKAI
ncbi:hypothetical protein [Thermoflexibacter ruber]|uniref:Uncharacterized protein n=1 Tax=Thermoflexibacter ruber TaxID=1003 RepID=A0A1I2HLQ0_9BACT|nr:hypothetical protein [Thermoflexibacter ruber]SFF29321.1 hypothetical protein SAMN04488541_102416 [Thermoflexibacter ruber]